MYKDSLTKNKYEYIKICTIKISKVKSVQGKTFTEVSHVHVHVRADVADFLCKQTVTFFVAARGHNNVPQLRLLIFLFKPQEERSNPKNLRTQVIEDDHPRPEPIVAVHWRVDELFIHVNTTF